MMIKLRCSAVKPVVQLLVMAHRPQPPKAFVFAIFLVPQNKLRTMIARICWNMTSFIENFRLFYSLPSTLIMSIESAHIKSNGLCWPKL